MKRRLFGILLGIILVGFGVSWAGPIEKSKVLLAEGNYEEAVEVLQAALIKDPKNTELWEAYNEAVFKYLLSEKASETPWPRMRPKQFVELVVMGKKKLLSLMPEALWKQLFGTRQAKFLILIPFPYRSFLKGFRIFIPKSTTM